MSPLPPLRSLAPMRPSIISAYCPAGDCSGGGGSGTFDPNQGWGYMPQPGGGPQTGVDFPSGSGDGGGSSACTPGVDPNCGVPGYSPGPTTGATVGGQPSTSTGSGCGILNPWPCLERIAAFLLGLVCIIGGIYLYKPSVITAPVKAATKAGAAAAA